jgi:hypothetical protein
VKRIVWTEVSKADVRSLDKPTAMHVLSTLDRFAESGAGDVKALQGRDDRYGEDVWYQAQAVKLSNSVAEWHRGALGR